MNFVNGLPGIKHNYFTEAAHSVYELHSPAYNYNSAHPNTLTS